MNPQCPQSYAKHLAGYIADPSTIRVRVLEYFDRAPSVEQCAKFRAAATSKGKREAARYEAKDRPYPCGHERTPDNTIWAGDHAERCKACRRQLEAAASERYRARVAAKEAERQEQQRQEAERQQAELNRAIATAMASAEVTSDLISSVCTAFSISQKEFLARVINRRVVLARSVAARIMRDRSLSLPKIGAAMKRDHSSVSNLLAKFDKRIAANPEMAVVYRKLAA
jgi:hypothetical protein